ncbi:glycine betaine ABC transporter substrate-binding protein [Desulfovermiculus halophilus]|uniref:glycine betaine ABC transporter substrate-binding protein n=1 Tax=Desulfovermiculus halophilus TaxID=339722 RepID=UPI000ABDA4D1|nr:glycine betaine ABC transporter substrate-binding protein [Desulfovermiculus halophilus]
MSMHKLLVTSLGVLLGLCLLVPGQALAKKEIAVGGKNFTEQYILANFAKVLLEENGFDVTMKTGVGSTVCRQSLEHGQIDMYFEYTGTGYTVFLKQDDKEIMSDKQKVYEYVRKADAENGLIWLEPLQFNNTYTLLMRKDQAQELGISSISDLAQYMNENPDELTIGVNSEFWARPDGFKPLMRLYDFRVPYGKVRKMDSGLVYQALRDGNVDVSMGFATDGRIAAFGFITLADDKSYFPTYNPCPVVREDALEKYPELKEIFQPLSEKLTTEEMQKLNAKVDLENKDEEKTARDWLKANGLI